MIERVALLRKLVEKGHLNVAERQILGRVTRAEVASLVESLLLQNGVFPLKAESRAVYEGFTITLAPQGVEITWRRASAWDPFTLAEETKRSFAAVDLAIDVFIASEWGKSIDGVKLE